MRTIDARHLDVPTEELLEYLSANIRMNVRNSEQQIIITPSQLENIEDIYPLYATSSMGYMCTFMGVPVKVEPREPSIQGNPFPEPIIAERIRGEYEPKKRTKAKEKEAKQPKPRRHVPVWKD